MRENRIELQSAPNFRDFKMFETFKSFKMLRIFEIIRDFHLFESFCSTYLEFITISQLPKQ